MIEVVFVAAGSRRVLVQASCLLLCLQCRHYQSPCLALALGRRFLLESCSSVSRRKEEAKTQSFVAALLNTEKFEMQRRLLDGARTFWRVDVIGLGRPCVARGGKLVGGGAVRVGGLGRRRENELADGLAKAVVPV